MQGSTSEAAPPSAEPTEVRLALALNGGVSLAVWMGGIAVELDSARRAHLGDEELGPGRTRSVYTSLCAALERELVIDVMAGASAGGINAALLAGAMSSARRLHPDFIRDKWLELGDLEKLLQPTNAAAPPSLLQGEEFHGQIRKTFAELLSGDESCALPKGQLDAHLARCTARRQDPERDRIPVVEMTATDLAGEVSTVYDETGAPLSARQFKARFRFAEKPQFNADELATAARSSASFPVAFEPLWVDGDALERASLTQPRWMIDGGLLNNTPIATALQLIPTRIAGGAFKRLLVYINPDPKSVEDGGFFDPAGTDLRPPGPDAVIGRAVAVVQGADFIEHVRALQRALQPAELFAEREGRLLALDLQALEQTANALVPSYRLERGRASIEELTGVAAAPEEFEPGAPYGALPWLTATSAGELPGPGEGGWGLGVRAAQRALHLCVDALRRGAAPAEAGRDEPREAAARELDELVAQLERRHQVLTRGGQPDEIGAGLAEAVGNRDRGRVLAIYMGVNREIDAAMRRGAEILWGALQGEDSPLFTNFFGAERTSGELDIESFEFFIRRLRAIEVVRRAGNPFAPAIETAAAIDFIQFTPFVDSPLMARGRERGPNEPKQKLCGLQWAHFSAFYKRSWRANDYMSGRLDGAARVVATLFDGVGRIEDGRGWVIEPEQAAVIAAAVFPAEPDETDRWLIRDALGVPAAKGVDDGQLREWLRDALVDVVTARDISIRAAQLEVMRDELDHLVRQSRIDYEHGSATPPLQLAGDLLSERIEALRSIEPSLPEALGRDTAEEMTSDLLLRTAARAMFVGLSAISAMKKPLGKVLGSVRPALYTLSGTVSDKPWHRLTALLGFLAASCYLAARAVLVDPATAIQISPDGRSLIDRGAGFVHPGAAPVGSIDFASVLVALIAIAAIAGFVLAPAIRLWKHAGVLPNLLLVALIALGAGITAIVPTIGPLTEVVGGLPILSWLLAPDVSVLPDWLEYLAILITVGIAVGSAFGGKLLGGLKQRLTELAERPWAGWWTMAALAFVSVAILWWSAPDLWQYGLEAGERWEQILAILVFGCPLLIAVFLIVTLARVSTRRPPVRIWGVSFESVVYAGDVLTLQRKKFAPDDQPVECAGGLDQIRFSTENGVTQIRIAKAASRAAAGESFARVPDGFPAGLPIPPAKVRAIVAREAGRAPDPAPSAT